MTNNGNPSGISGVSVGTNGTLSITGDLVKATQLKLLMLGYMKTVPTGVLDSVTTEALRGYQTANKLQITGTITPETNTSLNSYIGAVSVTKNTNPSLSIGATSVK